MVTKALDPHGVSAEKQKLVSQQTTLAAAATAYTGDFAGAQDLRIKLCENDFRLNITAASRANKSGFDTMFAYSGFGLEQASTS